MSLVLICHIFVYRLRLDSGAAIEVSALSSGLDSLDSGESLPRSDHDFLNCTDLIGLSRPAMVTV